MTAEKVRSTDAAASPTGRGLTITRVLDAPRALVFKVWTSPEHLARWWGPHGFTNPRCEADPRPGGAIRIDMTGPDGTVYPMKGEFREVVEPERLVFATYALEDEAGRFGLKILNTVTFADEGGKTRLTLHAEVIEAAPEAAGALAGMEVGWTQTLERLAVSVTAAVAGRLPGPEFVICRAFDAPRDRVFRAWTDADRLARWFGPKGSSIETCTVDLRPGGLFHYSMRSPDGGVMWGRWAFREVVEPERLVFVFSFSDEAGGVTPHPFAPDWPREVLSTVTFDEHDGRTLVMMRGTPLDATEAEETTFEAGRGSMKQGWTGTLDQLADYLTQP